MTMLRRAVPCRAIPHRFTLLLCFLSNAWGAFALPPRPTRIRDITEIQGVRENQLIGYGLVVGLQGTGDRQQTFFTVQTQGPLITGGYSESAAGQLRAVNYPTVGRVPEGAIIERKVKVDLRDLRTVSFLLRQADFSTARDVADAINKNFGALVASASDSRHIDVDTKSAGAPSIPLLISRIQNLSVDVTAPAKVVLNERTGTIVLGGDVLLSPVSVLHGGLQIQVDTVLETSQPAPFSNGTTTVTPNTQLTVQDKEARSIRLGNGANVEELIKGLHAIGATAHDIVSILQAVKAAGGLQADLEVI